jgi:hypothetical protein
MLDEEERALEEAERQRLELMKKIQDGAERRRRRKRVKISDADEDVSEEAGLTEVGGRMLTAAQIRERHFTKMKLLVIRARKAAEGDAGIAEMQAIQAEIRENLGDVDAKRVQTQMDCSKFANLRRKKRLLRDQLDDDLKDVRMRYLRVHDRKVRRAELEGKDSGKHGSSRYNITIDYLKQEIRKVRAQVMVMRLRVKTQAIAGPVEYSS